jgi:hypothetical protein
MLVSKKLLVLAMIIGASMPATGQQLKSVSTDDQLEVLAKAYPGFINGHDRTNIFWRDGTKMSAVDQADDKSFDQLLKHASIVDQFKQSYPRGRLSQAPAFNSDPGRFRNEEFFKKMYGDCRKGEVDANLVTIIWLPKTWGKQVRVTKVNDVAARLAAVSDEIDRLPPEIKKAAYPIAGVLSCRPVADTGKMSMHSYGAAIDLNLAFSDYWFWQKRISKITYRNRMPAEIVDIFERHGFIWGGKWYHFDTMHFEYRPELLDLAGG